MALTMSITTQDGVTSAESHTIITMIYINAATLASSSAIASIYKDEAAHASDKTPMEKLKFTFTYAKNTTHAVTQAQDALALLTSVTLLDGTTAAYDFTTADKQQNM